MKEDIRNRDTPTLRDYLRFTLKIATFKDGVHHLTSDKLGNIRKRLTSGAFGLLRY
jgi:hypothetical protein